MFFRIVTATFHVECRSRGESYMKLRTEIDISVAANNFIAEEGGTHESIWK